jgi:hypothetical protein
VEETNPPVVLNYATPAGHTDSPPAGSRLRLDRNEGGVCIIDPPRGRVAAIPALLAIGLINSVLLLVLVEVVRQFAQHGIPLGRFILDIVPVLLLMGAFAWQARLTWRSVQLPKTVEVRDGFLRLTNHLDLFGRISWRIEKIRRVVAVSLGPGHGIARPMRMLFEVGIRFRGFRFQRRVFKYLSWAEAMWAANTLNREMNLPEIRPRRRMRWFSID